MDALAEPSHPDPADMPICGRNDGSDAPFDPAFLDIDAVTFLDIDAVNRVLADQF